VSLKDFVDIVDIGPQRSQWINATSIAQVTCSIGYGDLECFPKTQASHRFKMNSSGGRPRISSLVCIRPK